MEGVMANASNNDTIVVARDYEMEDLEPAPLLITATPTQPREDFPILELPAEIRYKIFEFFFRPRRVVILCQYGDCSAQCGRMYHEDHSGYYRTRRGLLNITLVSKLIRQESIDALLRTAIFDFQLLDTHYSWKAREPLRSYVNQIRRFYGPPRLMHYLAMTPGTWHTNVDREYKWMTSCTAQLVVCDMLIDQFDVEDAIEKKMSNEALYFGGLKNALSDARGPRVTLCVQLQDGPPVFNNWTTSHVRSRFLVWSRQVYFRRRPATQAGKTLLKKFLDLLGLQLRNCDKSLFEPVQQPQQGGSVAATNAAAAASVLAGHNPPGSVSTMVTATTNNTNASFVNASINDGPTQAVVVDHAASNNVDATTNDVDHVENVIVVNMTGGNADDDTNEDDDDEEDDDGDNEYDYDDDEDSDEDDDMDVDGDDDDELDAETANATGTI